MQVQYLQIRSMLQLQYLQIMSTLQVHLKVEVLQKFPLCVALKVPELCPEVDGNTDPWGKPLLCNIATLATELK